MPAKLTRAALDRILAEEAPFADMHGFVVEEIGEATARCRLPYSDVSIRPGGTISGPAMFALADFTLWIAVMARIGPVPLAVTTDMTIHFLTKPGKGDDLIGQARLLKNGRRLCVGEVTIFGASDPAETPVAHVTGTYSIPPDPSR
ncbi:PaaI family thioesterase [Marivibrio halodurans]|uniref:PaaI family thioesterase n=1 Tax=Marivibrio halodurans TaxID=2039722 RepID=A0A8J7V1X2_9PROT|nr:PaaI family thioesterase [Marivibrio halodurans]MBP5856785.1 PaaI family thioesterase [Marivibrio halodurans]